MLLSSSPSLSDSTILLSVALVGLSVRPITLDRAKLSLLHYSQSLIAAADATEESTERVQSLTNNPVHTRSPWCCICCVLSLGNHAMCWDFRDLLTFGGVLLRP